MAIVPSSSVDWALWRLVWADGSESHCIPVSVSSSSPSLFLLLFFFSSKSSFALHFLWLPPSAKNSIFYNVARCTLVQCTNVFAFLRHLTSFPFNLFNCLILVLKCLISSSLSPSLFSLLLLGFDLQTRLHSQMVPCHHILAFGCWHFFARLPFSFFLYKPSLS